MTTFKLVNNIGVEIAIGSKLETFRGEACFLRSIETPRHAGSTGKIYVSTKKNDPETRYAGFYPSVCNLKFVEA